MSAGRRFGGPRLLALLGLLGCAGTAGPAGRPRDTEPPADAPVGGGPGQLPPAGGDSGTTSPANPDPTDGPPSTPPDAGPAPPAVVDASDPEDVLTADGPCAEPAIDGYQLWLASGEGATMPARGSLLVPEGDHNVARVTFVGIDWHVIPVPLANDPDAGMVDLSKSSGFTLTYSASAELWVQLRSNSHWNGGSQFLTKVPATGGQTVTRMFPFARASWTSIADLGIPSWTFESVLAEARGLVFVGRGVNTLTFSGLKVDGYVPPCRPPKKRG